MGGVCIALYGFIAVSVLRCSSRSTSVKTAPVRRLRILIAGIGGLTLGRRGNPYFNRIALILGILTNIMLSKEKDETTRIRLLRQENLKKFGNKSPPAVGKTEAGLILINI